MQCFAFTLPVTDPVALFAAVQHIPYSLFFDSARPEHHLNNHSFIAFLPIETIEAKNGRVMVTNREQQFSFQGDPFKVVTDRLEQWGMDTAHRHNLPPFQGGAAGMFGYDLVRYLEKIPDLAESDPDMPDMAVGIYNQVISIDHDKDQAWHIVHAGDEQKAQASHAQLMKALDQSPGIPALVIGESAWQARETKEGYKEKIRKAIEYIHAGDVFQTVISQRFDADLPDDFDPFAHYCHLREVNAAPFGVYMNLGSLKIASASPERFIKVDGRKVETRPIKGTRPKNEDPFIDQFCRNELENSEKDRAENAMIVDLLRNDLSKVCEDYSIEVPELCRMESFASVHHLVSTITGSLRANLSPVDLLRACFPGGSITGCPKIRAMEITEELEPTRRGPYCGALGYVGFDGTMDTNIAIRTLVYQGSHVHFQVGGGIVADSNPEKEYQETMDKAEAIFRSFEATESIKGEATA